MLTALVPGAAKTAPVLAELAVFFIEIPEERLDAFDLACAPERGVYVAHDLIERFKIPPPVVIALCLNRVITATEKLGGAVRVVPEAVLISSACSFNPVAYPTGSLMQGARTTAIVRRCP